MVCTREAQKKHDLKPVRIYEYENETKTIEIEISILSTEKLFASQEYKSELHWWEKAHIVRSYSEEAEAAFAHASTITPDKLLDRLWTALVLFEINSIDIEKQIKKAEPVSVKILLSKNIEIVIDAELSCVNQFPSWKQSGRVLKDTNKELYETVRTAQEATSYVGIQEQNQKLRGYLHNTLKPHFSEEEIENWEKYNLTRVTFQYQ